MSDVEKFRSLRRFNLFMACLHFAQGVAMLILVNDFKLPVTSSYLKFDLLTQKLTPQLSTVFQIRIGPLVAVFLFISALAHLFISLPPKINDWYNKNLGRGINFARWIEYSFSSSIMIVVIAMLVGIYDIASLLILFFLNAMMILFGWLMEVHNRDIRENSDKAKVNWTSFYFGCIAGVVCWVAVAIYLFSAGSGEMKAPNFVYWIYFSIFLFFNCFAVNQVLQYKKIGKWSDYLYGERVYIILSLVAKSLLAWQVFFGTLRPV
ncbi:MAG: heliorhodopsin HeR [Candidatus Berkelbacteria bacterium]|nr:heliorhodopsin HeR [Candidatus Berkelbacteria bacterium]